MHLPVSRRTRPHMTDAVEKVENTAAARVWQRSARSELLAREAFVAKVGRPGRNLPLWQRCKDLCVGSELQNARARQSLRLVSIGAMNPSLTAIANAIRVGDHLLQRLA